MKHAYDALILTSAPAKNSSLADEESVAGDKCMSGQLQGLEKLMIAAALTLCSDLSGFLLYY